MTSSRTAVLFAALAALVSLAVVHAFVPQRSMAAAARSRVVHSATPAEVVDAAIAENDVMVFSKSTCPFCARTKALLDSIGVDYTALELNERDDGGDIQMALAMKSGQRTVPNVWVKGHFVGGNDDTQKANADGTLAKLIEGDRA